VRVDRLKPVEEGHLGGLIHSPDSNSHDLSMLAFVVGLKRDLQPVRSYESMKDFRLESSMVSARDSSEELRESVHVFLDRVIQRRHYGKERRSSPVFADTISRRPYHSRFDDADPEVGEEHGTTGSDSTTSASSGPHSSNEPKTWSGWSFTENVQKNR